MKFPLNRIIAYLLGISLFYHMPRQWLRLIWFNQIAGCTNNLHGLSDMVLIGSSGIMIRFSGFNTFIWLLSDS